MSSDPSNPLSPSPSQACVARIVLAYDGSGFHGWQVQPGLRTVQGELVRVLSRLIPLEGIPPGAGRTDRGVHARGQVVSVALTDAGRVERLRRALPRMLPEDMAALDVAVEAPGFHARHAARGRRYAYRWLTRPDPLRRRTHLLVRGALDLGAMQRACADLPGEQLCDSFCVASSLEPDRSSCRIREAFVEPAGADAWQFQIRADRFLHSMVRTIVGTLLEVGRGRRPSDCFPTILAERRRSAAGFTAPAHGLCLEEVEYGTPAD